MWKHSHRIKVSVRWRGGGAGAGEGRVRAAQSRCLTHITNDVLQVRNRCEELLAPVRKSLRDISQNFEESLELGLNPATRERSSLKCYNTHLQNIRLEQEKGDFLSLHLGANVLNFMRITIHGPNEYTPRIVNKRVPEMMKRSCGDLLFDYIAEKLRDFVWGYFSFRTEHVPLVFCFSFPLELTSLDRGTIQGWAKGYLCEKTVGMNVNTLLRQAALNKGLSLDIKAIVNDVGGCFVVGRTKTRLCSGSIIVGSGTNASYLESVKKVVGFQGDFTSPHVLINTEWGGYGDKGELTEQRSEDDVSLDTDSINPGVHLFEKMTSGLYIGELVRLFLVRLTQDKLLLDGQLTESLMKKNVFKSDHIIDFIHEDETSWQRFLEQVLKVKYTGADVMKIREVCLAVGERASLLVAACTAALARRTAQPVVAFATEGRLITGGLLSFQDLQAKALALADKSIVKKIYLVPTSGSALKGAALLASCL